MGIGAEAYRRVYPRAHPISTARVCACQLLTNPNIVRRTVELRRGLAKRADITEDKILTDYEEALQLGKAQGKPNAIIKASACELQALASEGGCVPSYHY
jgi:hypothetical protein